MPSRAAEKIRPKRSQRILGSILIAAAFVMLAGAGLLTYAFFSINAAEQARTQAALKAPKVAVPTQTVTVKPETVTGTPVKFEAASVGVSQPVDRGEYNADTGEWTLSYRAVYWGSMTAPINSQTGNTFIYGHDVPQIFGNLLNMAIGDKAVVTTDNGYAFTYTLRSSEAVDPTDMSKLQPTDQPTLTVQTCSGTWYQYRQMLTFSLDGYKKVAA